MPFPFMLLLNLIFYVLTTFVVSLLPNSLWFHLISAGTITTAFMMDPSGAGGDDHPSSSFFEGLSDWVQNPAEPGEEINSQPSQGVGQRLPGSSSPGISGESLFRDLEQPSGEPAPNIPPVEPPVEEQVEVSDRDRDDIFDSLSPLSLTEMVFSPIIEVEAPPLSPVQDEAHQLVHGGAPQVGIPQEDGAEHLPVIPGGGEGQEEALPNEADYEEVVRRTTYLSCENARLRSQIALNQILLHLRKRD